MRDLLVSPLGYHYSLLSVIDPDCTIGLRSQVFPFCEIGSGTTIGKDCVIGHGTVIHPNAAIGDRTKIWQHCQVQSGGVIGSDCTIGHNCVISGRSTVGNGVTLESNIDVWPDVSIDDDVFVGPSAVFTNDLSPRAFAKKGKVYIPTQVKRGASIGANATIICGITIGRYAAIAAGAIVTRDVPDYGFLVGSPGKLRGYVCSCNQWGRLSFQGNEATCPSCKRAYVQTPIGVHPKE